MVFVYFFATYNRKLSLNRVYSLKRIISCREAECFHSTKPVNTKQPLFQHIKLRCVWQDILEVGI